MYNIKGCDKAGDGFCDDAINDGLCQFDGGDCCIPEVSTDYCIFCKCYATQPIGKYEYAVLKVSISNVKWCFLHDMGEKPTFYPYSVEKLVIVILINKYRL